MEEKFGCQELNMVLVCPGDLLSLDCHRRDVVFISPIQIVHSPQQVLFFVGEFGKLVLKSSLLSLAMHLLTSQVLKLVG